MIRLLQVCPFHVGALQMGGPLTLMRKLGTAPPERYTVVGLVTPHKSGQTSDLGSIVIGCREIGRYRTVLVTELPPLASALDTCDVAFIHGYRHWLPTWAAYYCRRKNKPYIVHLHGMANRFGRSRVKKLLFDCAIGGEILRSASRIVCSSQVEMRTMLELFPDLRNITVVPHGLDADCLLEHREHRACWQTRLGLRDGEPLVVTLGRINRTKNYEAVMRAMPGIPSASLVIVGPAEDPGYWQELQTLGAKLGIANRLHCIEGLYGAEKTSLLAAASAFVTTSLVDSFSLVVAEAVAQGTPALFPEWIGIAEYLRGPGCYPFRSLEPAKISSLIMTAIAGPRVPVDDVLNNLRWRSILDKYGELVQEVFDEFHKSHEAAA